MSIAEIFFGNSTGIGMPCVCAPVDAIEKLAAVVNGDPATEIVVDLESMQVRYRDESISITMPESAREALLSARWDPISELLGNTEMIEQRADALPYI